MHHVSKTIRNYLNVYLELKEIEHCIVKLGIERKKKTSYCAFVSWKLLMLEMSLNV